MLEHVQMSDSIDKLIGKDTLDMLCINSINEQIFHWQCFNVQHFLPCCK